MAYINIYIWTFQVVLVKEPACQCRRHKTPAFNPWVRKIPWRRAWQPTSVFLPGKPHGQRSLMDYSLEGHRVGHDWRNLAHTHTNIHVLLVFSRPVMFDSATPWTAARQASVSHHLLKFAQVHVHCISDAIQASHPLTPSSSALSLSWH